MKILKIICHDIESIDYLLLTENGEQLASHSQIPFKELSDKIDLNNVQIQIFIASPDITLKTLPIPKNVNNTLIQKILPGMLEDDLLLPIESIHYAVMNKSADKVTVALICKEILNDWLARLKEFNIVPHTVLPLSVVLDTQASSCAVWFTDKLAIVKDSNAFSMMIEAQNLPIILQAHYDTTQSLPTSIVILNSQHIGASQVNFLHYPELAILLDEQNQSIWQSLNTNIKGNLITPSNAFSFERNSYKKILFHATAATLFIFIMSLGFETLSIYKLYKQNSTLNESISLLYKELYPQATEVVSPERRIQNELKTLSGAKAGSFYDLLFHVGRSLIKNPTILLKNVKFNGKKLNINIESQDYTDIDKFIRDLQKDALAISQDKTEQQGKVVKVSISISGGTK